MRIESLCSNWNVNTKATNSSEIRHFVNKTSMLLSIFSNCAFVVSVPSDRFFFESQYSLLYLFPQMNLAYLVVYSMPTSCQSDLSRPTNIIIRDRNFWRQHAKWDAQIAGYCLRGPFNHNSASFTPHLNSARSLFFSSTEYLPARISCASMFVTATSISFISRVPWLLLSRGCLCIRTTYVCIA